jgi:hypothetical protein
MVFSSTFNDISVITWWSVLLVEETGETHWSTASHWPTLSHNAVSSTPRLSGIRLRNVNDVIGTDCICSSKSKHHPITTTTAPIMLYTYQLLVWRVMVFNVIFNNISVTSWWSVLLVEEIRDNHRHATSHWQTLSHKVVPISKGLLVRCHCTMLCTTNRWWCVLFILRVSILRVWSYNFTEGDVWAHKTSLIWHLSWLCQIRNMSRHVSYAC